VPESKEKKHTTVRGTKNKSKSTGEAMAPAVKMTEEDPVAFCRCFPLRVSEVNYFCEVQLESTIYYITQ